MINKIKFTKRDFSFIELIKQKINIVYNVWFISLTGFINTVAVSELTKISLSPLSRLLTIY